jgi:hypothetical protein
MFLFDDYNQFLPTSYQQISDLPERKREAVNTFSDTYRFPLNFKIQECIA